MELLVADGSKEEFRANVGDKRFKAIIENKEFSIDPTHREFRKVKEGEYVKE